MGYDTVMDHMRLRLHVIDSFQTRAEKPAPTIA